MAKAHSALAHKGEIAGRRVHGNAHVDRRYREADDFLKMFEDVSDEFCWGTVWAPPRPQSQNPRGTFTRRHGRAIAGQRGETACEDLLA